MDQDNYYLGIAGAVALGADCARRQVGAVIVSGDGHLLASGRNGMPSYEGSCSLGACPRGRLSYQQFPVSNESYEPGQAGYCKAIHAELDAILQLAPYDREGSTLYCTHEPCETCLRIIWYSGINKVVTPEKILGPDHSFVRDKATGTLEAVMLIQEGK